MIFTILIFFNLNIVLVFGCDIFLLGQCRAPPTTIDLLNLTKNKTIYCNQFKKHIDCYNKKLINCSYFYEYSSAIQTVKLNLIAQIRKVVYFLNFFNFYIIRFLIFFNSRLKI